jgi:hypothetical protein
MSSHLTAEETLQKYIDKMGAELGIPFYYLWQEVSWLYSKIEEFTTLFAQKPTRIDLMNEAAPFFFRIVEDILWENIVLSISRITDPAKTGDKENLSVQMLPSLIKELKLKTEVQSLVDESLIKVKFCKDWRNKRLAHRDLSFAIEDGIKQLEKITLNKIDNAIDSLADILNSIDSYYCDSTTYFKSGGGNPGNSASLLHVLYDGKKAEKDRMERLKSGKFKEEDTQHPEI